MRSNTNYYQEVHNFLKLDREMQAISVHQTENREGLWALKKIEWNTSEHILHQAVIDITSQWSHRNETKLRFKK